MREIRVTGRSVVRAIAIAVGLLLASALPSGAQPASGAQAAANAPTIAVPAPVAATIAKLTGGKIKVLHAFKAPNGLIGIAFSQGPGRNGIFYVSPDGKYLIQGVIMGSDGSNVTQTEKLAYLPKPPTAADNFAALNKTHSFLWGKPNAKKELWIVFDPNCIYCHKTYESLKKYVSDGTLKVHIIQVGFLKPSSLGKAVAILSAKDPSTALAQDEAKFNVTTEEGGIAPNMSDAQAVKLVRKNNAWMDSQGIRGTPYLLYKNPQGKAEGIDGYVANVTALLAHIGTGSG